jgi:hypothetical protein
LPHRSIREAIALAIHLVVHIARVDGRRRVTEFLSVRGFDGPADRFVLEPESLQTIDHRRSARMTAHTRLSALLAASCLAATCGGGTPVPTSPSAAQSFLTGTWTGTLTIDREGEPSTSGAATWTFAPVDGTNLQTFSVTIRSQNPWFR